MGRGRGGIFSPEAMQNKDRSSGRSKPWIEKKGLSPREQYVERFINNTTVSAHEL